MLLTIINVGYGDALLLQTDGKAVLLDGGSALASEYEGHPCRVRAVDYLRAQGVDRLDAVIISHIHEDHVCGLVPVLREIPAERLYVPYPVGPFLRAPLILPGENAPRSVPLYTAALNDYMGILHRALADGTAVKTLAPGDSIRLDDDLTMRVLAPKPANISRTMHLMEELWHAEDPSERTRLLTALDACSNHTSLLLRFDAPGGCLLAAADSIPAEWDEVDFSLLQNVNVLKLPHHAQADAVDEAYMRQMKLEYVVTTASSDRRYNSADARNYERLSRLFDPPPTFLFADEREYLPWFSHKEEFQAITIRVDLGGIQPGFIKIQEKERRKT